MLALSGWRQQGIDVVSRATGAVVQHVEQPGAFVGLVKDARQALLVFGEAVDEDTGERSIAHRGPNDTNPNGTIQSNGTTIPVLSNGGPKLNPDGSVDVIPAGQPIGPQWGAAGGQYIVRQSEIVR